MRSGSKLPRMRRTREHVIADLSINFVEKQVLLCGYTVQHWLHDYGTDLVISTYDDGGEVETGFVVLQVKAADNVRLIGNGCFVTVRIDRTDLRSWLTDPMPVILILYDAANDRAFWFYVQAAFTGSRRFRAARGSETRTIRIPMDQALDPAAVRRFRLFRDRIKEQNAGVIHCD